MIIGFTGTRHGMTEAQKVKVRHYLSTLEGNPVFHHGMCVGADRQAHDIALACGYYIIGHPPTDKKLYDPCYGCNERREDKYYTARNRDIVDESEVLIATPNTIEPVSGSGTWGTINYASRVGKRRIVIRPDGSVLDT